MNRATKEETRKAIIEWCNKNQEYKCLWPEKCECWDCENYHPFFSPLISEDNK